MQTGQESGLDPLFRSEPLGRAVPAGEWRETFMNKGERHILLVVKNSENHLSDGRKSWPMSSATLYRLSGYSLLVGSSLAFLFAYLGVLVLYPSNVHSLTSLSWLI